MRFYKIIIVGLLFFAVLNGQLINSEHKKKYCFDAGFGNYHSTDKTKGISWNISAHLLKNNTIVKLNFYNYEEFSVLGPLPLEKFFHIGMMIGKNYSNLYYQFEFLAGLGFFGGIKRGKVLYIESNQGWFNLNDSRHFYKKKIIAPSAVFEVNYILKPFQYSRIGVSFYVDLNYERPMYGLIYKIGFGKR